MALSLAQLGGPLGIAAEGLDFNRGLDGATADLLRRALLERLVLCIRGQSLTAPAYRKAMCVFGKPLPQVRAATRHPEVAEITILSSEDRDELGDGKRLIVGAH